MGILFVQVYLNVSLALVSWKATHFRCSFVGFRGGRRAYGMKLQSIFCYGEKQTKEIVTNVEKRKKSTIESNESSDSEPDTQQSTTTTTILNVPRFWM